MAGGRAKLSVFAWSHVAGSMEFLRNDPQVVAAANCFAPSTLEVTIHTALNVGEAVVVLHPSTPRDHSQVEEFLLKIDQQCKINTHYVIVISPQAKRFKSGVQSHSVINTFDEQATLRATIHGIHVISKATSHDIPQEEPAKRETVISIADAGMPRQPTLTEYFSLPSFRNAPPVLTGLSKDERERLAIAISDLGRGTQASYDPMERVANYLMEQHHTEVALLTISEITRYNPKRKLPVHTVLCPPPGRGPLDSSHKLYPYFQLPVGSTIEYCWVPELRCCILCWQSQAATGPVRGAFAQALVYTVVRIGRAAA